MVCLETAEIFQIQNYIFVDWWLQCRAAGDGYTPLSDFLVRFPSLRSESWGRTVQGCSPSTLENCKAARLLGVQIVIYVASRQRSGRPAFLRRLETCPEVGPTLANTHTRLFQSFKTTKVNNKLTSLLRSSLLNSLVPNTFPAFILSPRFSLSCIRYSIRYACKVSQSSSE